MYLAFIFLALMLFDGIKNELAAVQLPPELELGGGGSVLPHLHQAVFGVVFQVERIYADDACGGQVLQVSVVHVLDIVREHGVDLVCAAN